VVVDQLSVETELAAQDAFRLEPARGMYREGSCVGVEHARFEARGTARTRLTDAVFDERAGDTATMQARIDGEPLECEHVLAGRDREVATHEDVTRNLASNLHDRDIGGLPARLEEGLI